MQTILGAPNILQELERAHFRIDSLTAKVDRLDGYRKGVLKFWNMMIYVVLVGIAIWLALL